LAYKDSMYTIKIGHSKDYVRWPNSVHDLGYVKTPPQKDASLDI